MLKPIITHYWPWNEPDDVAWCGARMTDDTQHSPTPSCPRCRAALAIEDLLEARLAEEALIPLTDEDAR